jgi:hypothetical protein
MFRRDAFQISPQPPHRQYAIRMMIEHFRIGMTRECPQTSLPARLAALRATAAELAARLHRFRLIDGQASPTVLMLVELVDRLSGALDIAHFDKRESTRLSSGTIADDIDARNLSGRLEQRLQIGFGRFVGEITYV